MLLFSVTIEFKDLIAYQDYETAMGKVVTQKEAEAIPYPKPKRTTRYVAVYPRFGSDPINDAARLALKRVIGEEAEWDSWEAQVLGIERVGDVAVEQEYEDARGGVSRAWARILESAKNLKCSKCGEEVDPTSPRWRCEGETWSHHHGHPLGHVLAIVKEEEKP